MDWKNTSVVKLARITQSEICFRFSLNTPLLPQSSMSVNRVTHFHRGEEVCLPFLFTVQIPTLSLGRTCLYIPQEVCIEPVEM